MSQILETIAESLIDGDVESVKDNVNAAVSEGLAASTILNEGLLAGMDEVGVLFKEGEMFVPEVLVAAKAMQAGVEILKPMLAASGRKPSARIMTVTVEGDLHDIGVKLVGMMMEGAGFEVVNIGVDVPASVIVEKVMELKPDVIGLSAMLTTTMTKMKEVIDALRNEGINIPVMVGGAPLSDVYAGKIGAYYSSDANDAVAVVKNILGVAK